MKRFFCITLLFLGFILSPSLAKDEKGTVKGQSINQDNVLEIKDAIAAWDRLRDEVMLFLFPKEISDKARKAFLKAGRTDKPLMLGSWVHPEFKNIREKAEVKFVFMGKSSQPALSDAMALYIVLWNGPDPATFSYTGPSQVNHYLKENPFIRKNGQWFLKLSIKNQSKEIQSSYDFEVDIPLHIIR